MSELLPMKKYSAHWFSSHKYLFLHRWLFEATVNDRKPCSNNQIHVQIMKFMCCLNMVFTSKSSRRAYVCLHDVMRQIVAARNEHFVYPFVDIIVSRNDVFDVRFCKPMPFLYKEITIILIFFWRFWCDFRLGSGKMQE